MKWLAQLVAAAAVLTTPLAASAQSWPRPKRAPWSPPGTACSTNPSRAIWRRSRKKSSPRTTSRAGAICPAECWGRDASIKVVGGYSDHQRRQACQDLPPRKLARCPGAAARQI